MYVYISNQFQLRLGGNAICVFRHVKPVIAALAREYLLSIRK